MPAAAALKPGDQSQPHKGRRMRSCPAGSAPVPQGSSSATQIGFQFGPWSPPSHTHRLLMGIRSVREAWDVLHQGLQWCTKSPNLGCLVLLRFPAPAGSWPRAPAPLRAVTKPALPLTGSGSAHIHGVFLYALNHLGGVRTFFFPPILLLSVKGLVRGKGPRAICSVTSQGARGLCWRCRPPGLEGAAPSP